MNFKEALEDDMEVFFNLDEFAETRNIDGTEMSIVIDEDKLEELKVSRDIHIEGIHEARLLIYVKKNEFGGKPAVNAIIEVDDKSYRVIDSSEVSGVITIILGWYEE
jgi:hypothetical protein